MLLFPTVALLGCVLPKQTLVREVMANLKRHQPIQVCKFANQSSARDCALFNDPYK